MQLSFLTAKEWRSSWSGDWATWRDKPATRKAMDCFDQLGGSEMDRYITLNRIVPACLQAMRYEPKHDPGQKYRDKLATERQTVHELERAARTLAKACERNSQAMKWCLPGGANELGVRLSRPHDGEKIEVQKMGAVWFAELAAALSGTLPELHGGPWFNLFTLGNLHFEKPLKSGRPVEVTSMLAFELAFYLRMFTAGRANNVWSSGQRMPKYGKPCTHVVAAFCNATLNTYTDAKQVADRLRKLPDGVGLIHWQKPE